MVPEGWDYLRIGDIASVFTGGTPSRSNEEYWSNGDIPWARTTEVQNCTIEEIDIEQRITGLGLEKSSAKMVSSGSILIALIGQGKTRGQVALLNTNAAINQNCAAICLKNGHSPIFFFNYLLTQYHRIRGLSNSAGQSNLNAPAVRALQVPVPPPNEQSRIAEILLVAEQAVVKTRELIAATDLQKKSLVQQLLSGKRRLPGFEEEWEESRLRQFITEHKSRNRGERVSRVLSVSNKYGFILPEEQFSKRVASENVSNYKVVERGQYAYNPSRLNVGSFARLDEFEDGVVSPMYVVFSVDQENLVNDFYLHWMSSHQAQGRIGNLTQGSVRDSVSFDALGSLPISVPPVEEQVAIASVLSKADQEIELLYEQLESLKKEKKALMQQLLAGKRRVKVDKEVR